MRETQQLCSQVPAGHQFPTGGQAAAGQVAVGSQLVVGTQVLAGHQFQDSKVPAGSQVIAGHQSSTGSQVAAGSQVLAGSQLQVLAGSQTHVCSQVPEDLGDSAAVRELTPSPHMQPVHQLQTDPITNESHRVTETKGRVALNAALTSPTVGRAQILPTSAHALTPGGFFLLR